MTKTKVIICFGFIGLLFFIIMLNLNKIKVKNSKGQENSMKN